MTTEPVRELCAVDLDSFGVIPWITAIPFEEWPQQHRVDAQIRPAMVNDLAWHDFGKMTEHLADMLCMGRLAEHYNRMLSVVMPGHGIDPHRDEQQPDWIMRVHVPLTTNPDAGMIMEPAPHRFLPYFLKVGTAYTVDTRVRHTVYNAGATPRIHFMFDVRRL